jgi:hypothetical protein
LHFLFMRFLKTLGHADPETASVYARAR